MSYQVLARKWRPRNFEQMVGQAHVIRALINGLNQGRLHHAYLFTGTRGVGKTTLARILAKCLNCERGVSSKPCAECSACQEIDSGRFVDLIEVDAASRTKVEDTRELLENVQYAPTRGRNKVYLIDEVHMLSGHSFNALLKTLEEPPPHVKFLLATTDPQKLPVTILSRCLQLNLKHISHQMISDYLAHILDQEGIQADEAALRELARSADGSMRDALSLLDQAIAYGNGEVREAEVNAMLGSIPREHFQALVTALINHDASHVIAAAVNLAEQSADFNDALAELLSVLHQAALFQQTPQAVEEDSPHAKLVSKIAQTLSPEDIQLFYQIALIGRRDLPLAPDPRAGFEMVLLRMMSFRPLESAVIRDQESEQQNLANTKAGVRQNVSEVNTTNLAPEAQDTPNAASFPSSCEEESGTVPLEWPAVLPYLDLQGVAYALASNCSFNSRRENEICLVLAPQHAEIRTKNAEARLRKALSAYFAEDIRLRIEISEHSNETPAQLYSRALAEKQRAAEQAIDNDFVVRGLKEHFGAKVVPGSIKPIPSVEK